MKKLIILLLVLSIIATCVFSFVACNKKSNSDNLISIKDAKTIQTMEGFGASSCWWSQITGGAGNKDTIAKLLYSNEGLAFNIYRYNIGGGSVDIKDIDMYGEKDRLTESFLKGELYTGSTHQDLINFVSNDNNYDFTKDANAQAQLEASLSYGCIDQIVLFVNSPHYIMTKNNKCRINDGLKDYDNLAEENYDVFAIYLMKILKYFVVDKGYPVKYLSPINEPQWQWNTDKQEGCHYEPESCAKCLNVVYLKLKEFNSTYNTSVKLDGFESGNWNTKTTGSVSRITNYLEEMQKYDYFEELDFVSFHSYSAPHSKSTREKFMKKVENYNIKVGITEYCQMDPGVKYNEFGAAEFQALVMAYDISVLHAVEWTWWIAVSNETTYNYEDGLIYTNWWADELDEIKYSPRYYTLQHYSNFVKKGDKYVDIEVPSQLTAIEKTKKFYGDGTVADDIYNVFIRDDGTVIIVYTNVTGKDYTWNFKDKFNSIEAYTSSQGNYMVHTTPKDKNSYTFKPHTITTLILK